MASMGGNGVQYAVGADAGGLLDIELHAPARRALPRDQRRRVEIFLRQHFEIVQRARDHRADDHRLDVASGIAFELQQLVKPNGILVGGAARVGGDAPARADFAAFDKREDEVGISGIDCEQHQPCPKETSPACMTRTLPSAKRSRSAPLGSSPSKVPDTCSPGAAWTVERRAERVGAGEPARSTSEALLRHARASRAKAAAINGAKACGVIWDASAAVARPSSAGASARLTPKPATTRSPDALEQNPAELGAARQQVVGPFERELGVGRGDLRGVDQRQAAGERQAWRGRVGWAKA